MLQWLLATAAIDRKSTVQRINWILTRPKLMSLGHRLTDIYACEESNWSWQTLLLFGGVELSPHSPSQLFTGIFSIFFILFLLENRLIEGGLLWVMNVIKQKSKILDLGGTNGLSVRSPYMYLRSVRYISSECYQKVYLLDFYPVESNSRKSKTVY